MARTFEVTGTGEQLEFIAEVAGAALAAGVNAFTEDYYGDDPKAVEPAVVTAIAEIIKTQLVRPDGVKTIAKSAGKVCDVVE